ncbi:hypothetical protein [Erythrobacter sp. MTPC3]|uniref:hypothetical protein n=1 Tax=Erythrobacter sp. MTPC3 TaxID=3056564 RepID=UPI0036F40E1B
MRNIVILLIVFLIGIAAWFFLRGDGFVDQVTEARIEQALLDNQVPAPMADCMASRLVDQLTLGQLRKLERAAPQEGESRVPLSTGEAMERLRRVDDREAIETVAKTAASCGFDLMLQRL